jgi:regulator of RNase E activity RraA
MSATEKDQSVLELQQRWDKIRVANVYDALDRMGHPNQCLDLDIRPLFPRQHVAGKAVTARGQADPRTHEEIKAQSPDGVGMIGLSRLVFPGAMVVIGGGGAPWAGRFGEMTSWNIKQAGAKGIVIDGRIRDRLGLEIIPDYTVCARGTTPCESYGRWRIHETNVTIAMPGTLTTQVRVAPGDWIIGGDDGVVVIPQEIAMDALVKAEEIVRKEVGMRNDLIAGMPFGDAYKKWGRI